jgi:hypothetical protein
LLSSRSLRLRMHGQAAITIRLDQLEVRGPIGGIHQVPWAVQALRHIIAAGTIALGTVATIIGMPQLVAGSCRITTTTHRAPQAAQAPIGKTRRDLPAVMGPRPTATCVIERIEGLLRTTAIGEGAPKSAQHDERRVRGKADVEARLQRFDFIG